MHRKLRKKCVNNGYQPDTNNIKTLNKEINELCDRKKKMSNAGCAKHGLAYL